MGAMAQAMEIEEELAIKQTMSEGVHASDWKFLLHSCCESSTLG